LQYSVDCNTKVCIFCTVLCPPPINLSRHPCGFEPNFASSWQSRNNARCEFRLSPPTDNVSNTFRRAAGEQRASFHHIGGANPRRPRGKPPNVISAPTGPGLRLCGGYQPPRDDTEPKSAWPRSATHPTSASDSGDGRPGNAVHLLQFVTML
jgi:hypothetical protein